MKLFIAKLHYKQKLGFAELAVYPFLWLFSIFYLLVVRVRNFLYNKNFLKSFKSEAYVISVGNITTGGVGKTPVTAEIAKHYTEQGEKTAILLRGYGAKLQNKKPNIISDGEKIFYEAKEAGDEAILLSKSCSKVAVLTCSSRVEASKKAVRELNSKVLILDDAFQHRKIKRDLNLLLIDSKNKFGNKHILPLGPLRESLSEIKRADKIILVNKDFDDEDAIEYCKELEKKFIKKVYLCKMIPDEAYNLITGEPLAKFSRIMAFCAIGQPKSFYDFLKKDYDLVATTTLPDHHNYTQENIQELIELAQKEGINKLVTTEKDAVKVKEFFKDSEIDVFALKLKAYLDLEEILNG